MITKIYQPFDNQAASEEELDDEYIETGFHKKKPLAPETVLTGEAALFRYSTRCELVRKRIENDLQELAKLRQAAYNKQKSMKSEINYRIGWTMGVVVLSILLICWLANNSFTGFDLVVPAILGTLLFVYGVRSICQIGKLIRDYRCRKKAGKYVEYRTKFSIKTFEEELLSYAQKKDLLVQKQKQNEAIEKKVKAGENLTEEEVQALFR